MTNAIIPYETPYEARYRTREDINTTMNILFLTFFFAYMGYKILMDYTKSQNRWEDRMKILEEHMETIEENATYINNELVNSSEQIKGLITKHEEFEKSLEVLLSHLQEFPNSMGAEPSLSQWKSWLRTKMEQSSSTTTAS